MTTEQKRIGAVCPEIGTLCNWMQSLMKEENAGLVILNNAWSDWVPTSWMWRLLPGALVNHSQLLCGSYSCSNKHDT